MCKLNYLCVFVCLCVCVCVCFLFVLLELGETTDFSLALCLLENSETYNGRKERKKIEEKAISQSIKHIIDANNTVCVE